jgi:2-C-methyl-D-erythritol 4-phosphate cytidylyltransferase
MNAAASPARTAAIVPAAGRGERLGPGAPKALRSIGDVPILVHAVRSLTDCGRVGLVVVAAPPDGVEGVAALLAPFGTRVRVVAGGETRQQSVSRALDAVPEDVDIVLVHDAARALTPPHLVAAVADAVAAGHDAVIPVLPVADTIKSVDADDAVTATVDRSTLRAVQTPQGFRRSLLVKAHTAGAATSESTAATDDAGLVEQLGAPVRVIAGHPEAFKVTTPFDLILAEAVWARRQESGGPQDGAVEARGTESLTRGTESPGDKGSADD